MIGRNTYFGRMRKCSNCNKKIDARSIGYLCSKCLIEKNTEYKYLLWLETGDLGIKVGTTLRGKMREKLLHYYGNKCNICGISEWNGKELVLVLDHINGDASNNTKENLRFVCPNCDSQLDTYKSKNKNSARSHRKKYTEVV